MKTLLTIVFAGFAATAFAQQQGQPQQEPQQQLDKDTVERLRTEGWAGGSRAPTEREKQGAADGAGPHRDFNPGGQSREEHQEDSSRREQGRGARSGDRLQSGDARPGADRP